jgi:hypothetical protein
MAVAMAGASCAALVGSSTDVLGHFGLQDLLHYPLHDLAQKGWVVQQHLLRHLRVHITMIFGHRRSILIG